MLRLRLIFALLIVVGGMFSGIFTTDVSALSSTCLPGIDFSGGEPKKDYVLDENISFSLQGLPATSQVELMVYAFKGGNSFASKIGTITTVSADGAGNASFSFPASEANFPSSILISSYILAVKTPQLSEPCNLWNGIKIERGLTCTAGSIKISQVKDGQSCFWNDQNACMETGKVSITVNNVKQAGLPFTGTVELKVGWQMRNISLVNGQTPAGTTIDFDLEPGSYTVAIEKESVFNLFNACDRNLVISAPNACGEYCGTEQDDDPDDLEAAKEDPYFLCDQLPQGSQAKQNCIRCATGGGGVENPGDDESRKGIWTAIGCIKREPQNIVASLIQVGLMMGGGIALLMILAAGFLISTSQGDPKKVSDAKELITAAITGLLFIIFSVVMLQFIGFSVFKLPGFGG